LLARAQRVRARVRVAVRLPLCSQACALDAAAAPCLARPRVAPKLMLGRRAVLAVRCSPLASAGRTLLGTSACWAGLRLTERHETIRRVSCRAVRQRWAADELELPAPRRWRPGPARTLHRWIRRTHTCGSHATCGTSGTRRGSVGYGRGILAAWRTGQSSSGAISAYVACSLAWAALAEVPRDLCRSGHHGRLDRGRLGHHAVGIVVETSHKEDALTSQSARTRLTRRWAEGRVTKRALRFTGTAPLPPPPLAFLRGSLSVVRVFTS